MSIRNFTSTPKLDSVPDFKSILSKEEFELLKKGWRDHLAREGWACPRFNLVYSLLTGNPISEAFSPIVRESKLKSNPYKDPWYFVNSRLLILESDCQTISKNHTIAESLLKAWWTPWIGLIPKEKLIELGSKISSSIERK